MRWFTILCMLLGVLLCQGCKTLKSETYLPSSYEKSEATFEDFEDAVLAYEMVKHNSTSVDELEALGFDIEKGMNVKMMDYTEVIEMFLSNQHIKRDEIPSGVLECIEAQESCKAYYFKLENISQKRYGNFFLDKLGFKKKTRIHGWRFEAVFIVVHGHVVYSLKSGEHIDRIEVKKNPLGPLRDVDSGDLRTLL